MASLRSMLVLVSLIYCISVLVMLMYLPSIQHQLSRLNIGQSSEKPPKPHIHSHVYRSRLAREHCANLSGVHGTYEKPIRYFTIPSSKISIMAGYYDRRKPAQPYIRLIVLLPYTVVRLVNLHCHVPISEERMYTAPATLYEFNENHAMPRGGYVFSCPLPPRIATDLPMCLVRVTDGSSSRLAYVEIPLETVPRSGYYQRDLSVCVPPLFGSVDPRRLIEFMEFNLLLGVQHFHFYDFMKKRDNQTQRVLDHYVSLGLLTLRPWSLPVSVNMIWYKGQMLAIHHCLYANMGISKYIAFQDLDELFIPKKHPDLITMLQDIDSERRHCGFRFFSAFFPPSNSAPEDVISLRTRRSPISRVRTKCIVRPELIFEMGIHHISKQNVEEKTPHNIPETIVLLHHYRECDGVFGMMCSSTEVDTSVMKFSKALHSKYNAAVNRILKLIP